MKYEDLCKSVSLAVYIRALDITVLLYWQILHQVLYHCILHPLFHNCYSHDKDNFPCWLFIWGSTQWHNKCLSISALQSVSSISRCFNVWNRGSADAGAT